VCGLHQFIDNLEVKSCLCNYDIIVLCETWSKFKGEFDNLLSCYVHVDFVRHMKLNSIEIAEVLAFLFVTYVWYC